MRSTKFRHGALWVSVAAGLSLGAVACGAKGSTVDAQAQAPADAVADPCAPGNMESRGDAAVPSKEDMEALSNPDTLIGLAEGSTIVGYYKQGDLNLSAEERSTGQIRSLIEVVDKCGQPTGWMSREGRFYFTNEEVDSPTFNLDAAIAEKRIQFDAPVSERESQDR